jgi:hypothetical protein
MSRPLYESEADRANEAKVAAAIARKYTMVERHLPMAYHSDYIFFKNWVPSLVAEIKCRKHAFGTYTTYMISLLKVMRTRELAAVCNTKALLFVQYSDRLVFVDLNDDRKGYWNIGWGGRTDRNDDQDQEPVLLIPMDHFRSISL